MKKYASSILVIALCFITSFRYLYPEDCGGLVDLIWLMLFGSSLILYLIVLSAINIFQKIMYKRIPNYRPFFALFLSIVVIGLIGFLKSEKFKSKRILTANSSYFELILRVDNSYELIRREPEFSCKMEGNFRISNDTLYLLEKPKINETLLFNKKYIIDLKLKEVRPIVNDSINKENILKIE